MKAIQYRHYGDATTLQLVDVASPHPQPGQILIRVAAAAVNPIDWKIRSGLMQDMIPVAFPAGMGSDAAGIVIETGDGVTDVSVGDAVFGAGSSTYAHQAILTAWAPVPTRVTIEEAAGWGTPVETAVRVLDLLDLTTGQTLLVSGASGGVGTAVVQIAVSRGLVVVGTASETNQDYLAKLGAVPVPYGDGLRGRVSRAAPGGVDAALHISGTGVLPELVEITGDATRVLSISDFAALGIGARVSAGSGDFATAWSEAVALPTFRIPVHRRFPLAHASDAHEFSAAGHGAGRTILVP